MNLGGGVSLATGSEFGRRRDRRRNARRITTAVMLGVFAVLFVLAGFVLVRGCGSEEAGGENPGSNGGSAEQGLSEENGDNEEARGGNERTEEKEEPEPPFAAIPPPEDRSVARQPENGLDIQVLEDIAVGRFEQAAQDQYAAQTTMESTEEEVQPSVPEGQTLLAGVEDPSDGPLKEHRLVGYYGHPWDERMGILGEYQPKELMRLLKDQTAAYSAADPDRPAVPMIELIASVAQRDPGPDGLYVAQTPKEEIETYSKLAKENDALLMLDVQLGRATVMQEVEILRPFLELPHVHLAVDTEYSVEEGQVPGVDLGTVDGPEIQEAVEYLDRMVAEKNLPDKILMVHQFEDGIVTNKEAIQPTDNVEVVLHADGFGGPEAKFTKYRQLVRDQPIQYGGFKVFYRQDVPVLNPEQVLVLDPAPAVITYQ
jgi:hypothetical protein